jgi:hypothetical protein
MYYHDWVTVLHFLEDTHNMEGQVSKKDETETHVYCLTCLCLCKSQRLFLWVVLFSIVASFHQFSITLKLCNLSNWQHCCIKCYSLSLSLFSLCVCACVRACARAHNAFSITCAWIMRFAVQTCMVVTKSSTNPSESFKHIHVHSGNMQLSISLCLAAMVVNVF